MNITKYISGIMIFLLGTNAFALTRVERNCAKEINKRALKLKQSVLVKYGLCIDGYNKCNLPNAKPDCKPKLIDVDKRGKCSPVMLDNNFDNGNSLMFGSGSAEKSLLEKSKSAPQRMLRALVQGVARKCFDEDEPDILLNLGHGGQSSAEDFVNSLNAQTASGFVCSELVGLGITYPGFRDMIEDLEDNYDNGSNHLVAESLKRLVEDDVNFTSCKL